MGKNNERSTGASHLKAQREGPLSATALIRSIQSIIEREKSEMQDHLKDRTRRY